MTVRSAAASLPLVVPTDDHHPRPRVLPSGPPRWLMYVVAVVASGIGAGCTFAFPSLFAPAPFVLATIAVVIAAWLGGLLPGLLATTLGTVAAVVMLVYGGVEPTWRVGALIGAFVALGILISALNEARLRAMRRVVRADNQLIAVFDGLVDGVFLEDPKHGLLFANDAAAELTGFASGAELHQATLRAVTERFDFLDTQGRSVPLTTLSVVRDVQAPRGERTSDLLLEVRERATGRGRWWTIRAISLPHWRTPAVATVFRDITTQRQADIAIAASERRFRALIEWSADAFALLDGRGSLLFTSPAVSRVLGYREDELRGVNTFSLVYPDDIAEATALFTALRAPDASPTRTFRMRHREGNWRWIEATGRDLMDDPAVRAVLINLRDITDGKAAADTLAMSARWFDALLAQNADAVTVVDAEGNVAYASPATEHLLGYTPATFAATNTFAYVHPADLPKARELFATILPTPGEQAHAEYRMRHRNGAYRWVAVTATNLLHDPAVNGVVGTLRDVTDRKRSEARQRFLADANTHLTATTEDEDALAGAAGVAVPCFATGCAVELRGQEGKLRRAFTALPKAGVPDPFATTPAAAYVARALVMGQAARFVPPAPATGVRDDSARAALSPPTATMLVAPLVALEGTLGAVTLIARDDAPFDNADQAAVEEFAARLAHALVHARLARAVQFAEARYRVLLNGVGDAVMLVDAEGQYTDANAAFTDLLGYTLEEARRSRVGAFAVNPERAWEAFVAHRATEGWRGEAELKRRDGTLLQVEEVVVSLPSSAEEAYLVTWRHSPEQPVHE